MAKPGPQPPQKREPSRAEKMEAWTARGVWFAGAAAIASIVAVGVSFWQVQISRDATQRELRAYVGAGDVGLDCPTCVTGIIQPRANVVKLEHKNYGQTPAYEVVTTMNVQALPPSAEIPADFGFPDKPRPVLPKVISRPTPVTLYPGHPQTDTMTLSDPEVVDLLLARSGRQAVILYGHTDYRDVFGKKHSSPYCFIFDFHPAQGIGDFGTCGEHNTPD